MKTFLKLSILAICILLFASAAQSQKLTQRIKGKVFDNESHAPIPFANVLVLDAAKNAGVNTDENGNFSIENIPLGRYRVQASCMGYQAEMVPEVLVSSGKEVVLEIGLTQSLNQINEVTVKAFSRKELPVNSMAMISARSFTVEETRRYAGGMDDPARMASAFAGVSVGNIQDNAIVIRGNSPKGVSWRLEGVEIPNPNHFAGGNVAGGGFVTIFSSQLLSNSDFFTGAFPAEYGNALAGVFDMKLRTGNSEKRENTVQLGVLGIDVASEGPFVKGKGATYLFNYRFSSMALLSAMGLIPSTQIPKYQDLSFKLNFPTQKAGTFSLWGIGAIDKNVQPIVADSSKWEKDWDRTQYDWNINTGAIGLTHKYLFDRNTYINSTITASGTQNIFKQERLDDVMVLKPNSYFEDRSGKMSFNTVINRKFGAQHTVRIGMTQSLLFYKQNLNGTTDDKPETYQNYVNESGHSSYSEFFVQSKYDIGNHLTLNAGVNVNYFALTKKTSIDPRAALKWQFAQSQSISLGYGKHSQLEELRMYFIKKTDDEKTSYPNKDLGFAHAQHFVLGYEWMLNEHLRLKLEPYYQFLYDQPGIADSSWSMINFKQDWNSRNELKNNCIGENKGIDITFERFLNNNYYFLATASIFSSKYKADDGVWRNTRFNKAYVLNLLYGHEFTIRQNHVLSINGRLNIMGGERTSPVLTQESLQQKRIIQDETRAFEKQLPGINYLDLTISYRINKAKRSSVIALQIKNILGTPMDDGDYYNYKSHSIESSHAVVVIPALSYKVEF